MKQLLSFFPPFLVVILYLYVFAPVKGVYWEKKEFKVNDSNLSYLHFMCRYDIENCVNKTENPHPRQGHSAILFTTYSHKLCSKFIKKRECAGWDPKKEDECEACAVNDENYAKITELEKERKEAGLWGTHYDPKCPEDCCKNTDFEC